VGGLCDLGARDLLQGVDTLALVVESVHQMHVDGIMCDSRGRRIGATLVVGCRVVESLAAWTEEKFVDAPKVLKLSRSCGLSWQEWMLARVDGYSWSLTIALFESTALYETTNIYDKYLHPRHRRGRTFHTKHNTIWLISQENKSAIMKTPFSLVFTTLLLFVLPTFAQFQFFEQMFNQGGQQQQQPQNAASDSSWYKQQYEAGVSLSIRL
jgi:hypothetical protein